MESQNDQSNPWDTLSVWSTVLDALFAFVTKRYRRGVILLAAAALSYRVPKFGLLVSTALRGHQYLSGSQSN
ncbi:hypothetical protein ACOZ4I_18165 (plasmid) [Haloarcula salina]|uniref:hypothetical protein n=1 Tax=Haloarcula salina TaxID=1429914 RepID=UPI003C6EC39B